MSLNSAALVRIFSKVVPGKQEISLSHCLSLSTDKVLPLVLCNEAHVLKKNIL